MPLKQKVCIYIQEEIIIAISWEICDKLVKVWILEDHGLKGTVDLCEVADSSGRKIKEFIRKILKQGKFIKKNPMYFDTIGFEKV